MVYGDQDVISQLGTGIQKMPDSLNSLVTRIRQSGVQVTSSATQIAVATWDIEPIVSEMQSMVSTGVMGMEKFSERYTAVLTTCARPARSWPTLSSR